MDLIDEWRLQMHFLFWIVCTQESAVRLNPVFECWLCHLGAFLGPLASFSCSWETRGDCSVSLLAKASTLDISDVVHSVVCSDHGSVTLNFCFIMKSGHWNLHQNYGTLAHIWPHLVWLCPFSKNCGFPILLPPLSSVAFSEGLGIEVALN